MCILIAIFGCYLEVPTLITKLSNQRFRVTKMKSLPSLVSFCARIDFIQETESGLNYIKPERVARGFIIFFLNICWA